MEEKNNINAVEDVVNYNSSEIVVNEPHNSDNRYVVYIRPGDSININFDLKSLKVDVVRGDVVVIFPNGSTITLAAMASLGFGENAPSLISKEGLVLSLEEFLNQTEVLDYNQAVLILSNRDEIKYSDNKPDAVRTASPVNENLNAGTPISGVGDSDVLYKGVETPFIDPLGFVLDNKSYAGKGNFVVTINNSNFPSNKDKDHDKDGQTTVGSKPNIVSTIYYGTSIDNIGTVDMGNKKYTNYEFSSGLGITDDKTSQLEPAKIDLSDSKENLFINSHADRMKYQLDLSYKRGIFPSTISIVVPKAVADFFVIEPSAGQAIASITKDEDGNTVYLIDSIDPKGNMLFDISFPQNTPITVFDLVYYVEFMNPDTGKMDSLEVNLNLILSSVSKESDLEQGANVLSTTASGLIVNAGSGDDIIIGGGGVNTIDSGAGDNKVFGGNSVNLITFGDGKNEYWAGMGVGSIVGGSGGTTTVYYNNKNTKIDPGGKVFKDSYYNTYDGRSGVTGYLGLSKADILLLIPADSVMAEILDKVTSSVQDGSSFIGKASGFDVLKNVDEIWLPTTPSNTIFLSSYESRMMTIHGGGEGTGQGARSTMVIHDSFGKNLDGVTGAVIDLTQGYISGSDDQKAGFEVLIKTRKGNEDTDGDKTLYKLDSFISFKGGSGNDLFYVDFLKAGDVGDTRSLWFDGGKGSSEISYVKANNLTQGISFNSASGVVSQQGGEQNHQITNFNTFEGSKYQDTIYGSSFNYNYKSGGASDNILTYTNLSASVTYVLSEDRVYKNADKSMLGSKLDTNKLNSKGHDSILDIDNYKITLTKGDNIIIVDDNVKKGYDINGGSGINGAGGMGRNTLTYQYYSADIDVTIGQDGSTTVARDGMEDTSKLGYDMYEIVGSKGKTVFNASTGTIGKGHKFVGVSEDTTLTYNGATGGSNNSGVTFKLGGTNNSVEKSGGGTDAFSNIFNLVGTANNDDTVLFSSSISKIEEIKGYNIDLQGGTNTINVSQVSGAILGGNIKNASIQVQYNDEGILEVLFGYYNADGVFVSEAENLLNFKSVTSIVGTSREDIVIVKEGSNNIIFNGYSGINKVDYTGVTSDVVFDFSVSDASAINVYRGTAIINRDVDSGTTISGEATDGIHNAYDIYGGTGVNTYFSNTNGNYSFHGGGSSDILDYSRITTSVVIDFNASIVSKTNGGQDIFDDKINHFIGSSQSDVFILTSNIKTEDDEQKAITVDGSLKGKAQVSFAKIDEDIDITFEVGKENSITTGNVDWTLVNISGVVFNGDNNNNITLIGKRAYDVDGGEGSGTTTVLYNKDTNLTSLDINISGITSATKRFDGSASYVDNLTNVKDIYLAGQGNNSVNIKNGHGSSSVENIYGADGVSNQVSFVQANIDLIADISEEGFALKGLENNKTMGLTNFNIIRGSAKTTVFNITESISRTDLELQGSGLQSAKTTVDFSKATGSIQLTLANSIGDADSVAGAIQISSIVFASINEFVLGKDTNDTIYASSIKNASFIGNGGTNTIDYSKIGVTSGVGITINVSQSRIYKLGSEVAYDSYEDFHNIVGTGGNDTVVIDGAVDLDIEINLTDKGNNTVRVVDTANSKDISYNMATQVILIGSDSVSTDKITGANFLELGSNKNTLFFADLGSSAIFSTVTATGTTNTMDFSDISVDVFYYASYEGSGKAKVALVNGSQVGEADFVGFNVIQGVKNANNSFYGTISGSNSYIGGSKSNTLSYINENIGVTFNIGDGTVVKAGSNVDKFSNISIFEGSKGSNNFVFNDKALDQLDSLQILSASQQLEGAKDRVTFRLNKDMELTFDDNGSSIAVSNKTINIEFQKVDIFILETGSNTVNIGNMSRALTITGASSSDSHKAGIYDNVINYTEGDVTFSAITNSTTRVLNNNTYVDSISNFGTIQYSGKGSVEFQGNVGRSYAYVATDSVKSATLSYATVNTTEITFDFAKGTTKGTLIADSFKGITYFMGGQMGNTFILADNKGATNITINGGNSGNSAVSFENMYPTSGKVEITLSEFLGGAGASGYTLININRYILSKGDNWLIVDSMQKVEIDGNTSGNNTADYSELKDSSGKAVNISYDFINGIATKTTVDGASTSDKMLNFQKVITGDGDDSFIIGNEQVKIAVEAGGGNNALDFTAVTYKMAVVFGKDGANDFTVNYNTSGVSDQTYKSFTKITLSGAKDGVLSYYYSDAHRNQTLEFSGGSSDTNAINATLDLNAKTEQTLYVNLSSVNGTIRSIENEDAFLTFKYFKNITATSNVILNMTSSGTTNYNITANSSLSGNVISYASSTAENFELKVLDGASKSVIVTNSSNKTGETLYNFNTVVLKKGSTLIVAESTGSKVLNVDMTSDGTISFEGYTKGITGKINQPDGYNITGASAYTLTNYKNDIIVGEDESMTINGGRGANAVNIIRYTDGMTAGVTIMDSGAADTLVVTKAVGVDNLKYFTTIYLDEKFSNIYKYNGTGDFTSSRGTTTIDFGGNQQSDPSKQDIVDFSSAKMALTFTITNDIYMNLKTKAGGELVFANAEIFKGGIGGTTFVLDYQLPATGSYKLSGISLIGVEGADNTLDTSRIKSNYGFTYDLINGVVELTGRPSTILELHIENISHIIGSRGNELTGVSVSESNFYIGINNASKVQQSFIIDLTKGNDGGGGNNSRVFYNGNNFTDSYEYSPKAVEFIIGDGDSYTTTVIKNGGGDNSVNDELLYVGHVVGTGHDDTFTVKGLLKQNNSSNKGYVNFYSGNTKASTTVDLTNMSQNFNMSTLGSGGNAYKGYGGSTDYIDIAAIDDYNGMRFFGAATLKLGTGNNIVALNFDKVNSLTTIEGNLEGNGTTRINFETSSAMGSNRSDVNIDLINNIITINNKFTGATDKINIKNIDQFGSSTNESNGAKSISVTAVVNESSYFKEIWMYGSNSVVDMSAFDPTKTNKVFIDLSPNTNWYRLNSQDLSGNDRYFHYVHNVKLGTGDTHITFTAFSTDIREALTLVAGVGSAGNQLIFGTKDKQIDFGSKGISLSNESIYVKNNNDIYGTFSGFRTLDLSYATASNNNLIITLDGSYNGNISSIQGSTVSGISTQFSAVNIAGTVNVIFGSTGNTIDFGLKQLSFKDIQNFDLGGGTNYITITSLSQVNNLTAKEGGVNRFTFNDASYDSTFTLAGAKGSIGNTTLTNFNEFVFNNKSLNFNINEVADSYSGLKVSYTGTGVANIIVNTNINLTSIDNSVSSNKNNVNIAAKGTFSFNNIQSLALLNQSSQNYSYREAIGYSANSASLTLKLRVKDESLSVSSAKNSVDFTLQNTALTVNIDYASNNEGYLVNVGGNRVFDGFSNFYFGTGGTTVVYNTNKTQDDGMQSAYKMNMSFEAGKSENNTVQITGTGYSSSANGADMRGSVTRGGGMEDKFSNFYKLVSDDYLTLTIGYDYSHGKRSVYDTQGFQYASLAMDETNDIYIRGMEADKIVNSKSGHDNIYLTGNASDFLVEERYEQSIFVNGKEYFTGGKYLVITDNDGNVMYIFNAGYESIIIGGKKPGEEDQYKPNDDKNQDDSKDQDNANNDDKNQDDSKDQDNVNNDDNNQDNSKDQDNANNDDKNQDDSKDQDNVNNDDKNQDNSKDQDNVNNDDKNQDDSKDQDNVNNDDKNQNDSKDQGDVVDNHYEASLNILEDNGDSLDSIDLNFDQIDNTNNGDSEYINDVNQIIDDSASARLVDELAIENNYKLDSEGKEDNQHNVNDYNNSIYKG